MRCGRVDVVLSFALGTLLVCGVVNAVVAALWKTWWLWALGGACLTASLVVAVRWLRHTTRCGVPLPLEEPPEHLKAGVDELRTAA